MCPIPAYPAYMNAPAEMRALLDSLPGVYALMLYALILPHCLCLQKSNPSLFVHVALVQTSGVTSRRRSRGHEPMEFFCVSSNLSLPFFWGLSFLFWVKAWLILPASLTLSRTPGAKELYFYCAYQVCLVSCGLFLHISSLRLGKAVKRTKRLRIARENGCDIIIGK